MNRQYRPKIGGASSGYSCFTQWRSRAYSHSWSAGAISTPWRHQFLCVKEVDLLTVSMDSSCHHLSCQLQWTPHLLCTTLLFNWLDHSLIGHTFFSTKVFAWSLTYWYNLAFACFCFFSCKVFTSSSLKMKSLAYRNFLPHWLLIILNSWVKTGGMQREQTLAVVWFVYL